MEEKYKAILKDINAAINEFSGFLDPEYRLREIGDEQTSDKGLSWDLSVDGWNEASFPSNFRRGVYLLFGSNSEKGLHGVYVAKASYNNCIGKRLDFHLNNPRRDDKIYPMKDGSGTEYLIDFVTTIPLHERLSFLASSLEEYIVRSLSDKKIHLLNQIGRS